MIVSRFCVRAEALSPAMLTAVSTITISAAHRAPLAGPSGITFDM